VDIYLNENRNHKKTTNLKNRQIPQTSRNAEKIFWALFQKNDTKLRIQN